MGALHPSIVKHQTYLASIPQAVRPPLQPSLGNRLPAVKNSSPQPFPCVFKQYYKLEKLPCVDDVIKMT